jgi:hypothetical protein
MTKRWESDAKQRASKKYRDKHAQLKAEVENIKAERCREPRQIRHRAKDELYRLYGENASE